MGCFLKRVPEWLSGCDSLFSSTTLGLARHEPTTRAQERCSALVLCLRDESGENTEQCYIVAARDIAIAQ